ncbi:MAG: hypothetical protein D6732_21990, partial [Methanobacteriota archaeon]
MKKFVLSILIAFGFIQMVGAQQPFVNHPLEDYQFEKSTRLKNMAVLWRAPDVSNPTMKFYPFDGAGDIVRTDLSNLNLSGSVNLGMDMISSSFLDNIYRDEEIVVGYIDKNNGYLLNLFLLEGIPGGAGEASVKRIMFNSQRTAPSSSDPKGYNLRVIPVQADADSAKELLLAYWNPNYIMTFVLFDQYRDSILKEISSFESTEFGFGMNSTQKLFAITAEDFDNDGRDEILLLGPENIGGNQWEILTVDIFDIDDNLEFVEKSTDNFVLDYEYGLTRLDLTSGNANEFRGRVAVVAFQAQYNNLLTTRLKPFAVNNDLSGISYSSNSELVVESNSSNYSLDVEMGDLLGDDYKEVVFAFNGTLRLYTIGMKNRLTLLDEISSYWDYEFSNDNHKITVKNLDLDVDISNPDFNSINKAEIAVIGRYPNFDGNDNYAPVISIYEGVEGPDRLEFVTEKIDSNNVFPDPGIPIGIISGSYFPRDSRLGEPTHSSRTEILQPMVILNAPPVHFDVLNAQSYDINQCYNGNSCNFSATYKKTSTQTTELTTQVESDWTYSYGASLSLEKAGIKLESELQQEYGTHFSKKQGFSQEVTISLEVTASEDDRIYAVVADYDLWEYPVYINEEVVGHLAVVVPKVTENRWFPSKSWSGISYIPDHEVGNVLSYPEYPVLEDNPILAKKIKGSNTDNFVLDANSSYAWSLEISDFTSNEVETSWSNKQSANASLELWGLKGSVSASYEAKKLETQTTTVKDGISLSVNLGALDVNIGEVSYRVTPYAYWATNGALVIDYSIQPEISAGGGTPTWWEVKYGTEPDPSFILPWKYDPEKGFTLQDEEKRRQTKDIRFKPENPRIGDTTTVSVRVFNYSLQPTPGPVKIRLYVGNPDSGASQLIGTNGETDLMTQNPIPARGYEEVQVKWVV